jgi:hypothetical protein
MTLCRFCAKLYGCRRDFNPPPSALSLSPLGELVERKRWYFWPPEGAEGTPVVVQFGLVAGSLLPQMAMQNRLYIKLTHHCNPG